MGFFEPNRKPRCLKLTISPGCGCLFFVRDNVPAAVNFIPLGLHAIIIIIRKKERKKINFLKAAIKMCVQFTFPCTISNDFVKKLCQKEGRE